jgi:hypothetical protein
MKIRILWPILSSLGKAALGILDHPIGLALSF